MANNEVVWVDSKTYSPHLYLPPGRPKTLNFVADDYDGATVTLQEASHRKPTEWVSCDDPFNPGNPIARTENGPALGVPISGNYYRLLVEGGSPINLRLFYKEG